MEAAEVESPFPFPLVLPFPLALPLIEDSGGAAKSLALRFGSSLKLPSKPFVGVFAGEGGGRLKGRGGKKKERVSGWIQ